MAWPGAVCQDGPHQGAAEEAVEGPRGAASAAAVGEASEAPVCIGIWGGGRGRRGQAAPGFFKKFIKLLVSLLKKKSVAFFLS